MLHHLKLHSIKLPKVRLITSISSPTPSRDLSGGAIISNESGSDVGAPGSRDLMGAESVGYMMIYIRLKNIF